MFKSLTPNLMVEDVDSTIAWYVDVFDAEETNFVPFTADPSRKQWAAIKIGEVELMFQLRASLEEELPILQNAPIAASQNLYIGVNDMDAIYARLTAKQVTIVVEMHTTFYGAREVTIQDCNGYILTLSVAS